MKMMNNHLFFGIIYIVGDSMIVMGYKYDAFGCTVLSTQGVKDRLDELGILKITDDCVIKLKEKEVHMCDSDNPIVFVDSPFF